ncbi:MAG: YdbH domain-containing protein [Desulfotignum sp.]
MRFKTVSIGVLVVLGAAALVLLILAVNLPMAVQWFIQYRYKPLLSSNQLAFQVSHVGKSRTLVSDLQWGRDISADLVSVSYDIQGLSRPALQRLTLSGLTIQARYDPDQGIVIDPVLAGGSALLPQAAENRATADFNRIPLPDLTVLPDQIQVTNARLILTMNQGVTVIPFNISLTVNKSGRQVVCDAEFYPFGQAVTLKTRLHPVAGMETFLLEARSFDFQPLTEFLSMKKAAVLPGITDWSVEKQTHNTWQVSVSDMVMRRPDGLMIPSAEARILKERRQVTVLAKAGVSHPFFSDLAASGRALVMLDSSGFGVQHVDLTCETRPMEKLTLRHKNITTLLEQPLAALSLQMNGTDIHGNLMVSFSQTRIQDPAREIFSERGSVQSDIHGNRDTGTLTFDLTSQLSRIQMDTPDLGIRVNRMDTAGRVSMDMAGKPLSAPRVDLSTELVSGSITLPDKNMAVQGIWAQMPVTYPQVSGTGRFSVEKLMIDNRAVLTGTGDIQRTGKQDIRFDGTFQVPESDAVTIALKGTAGLDPDAYLHVTAQTNRFRVSPNRFGNLLPRLPFQAEYDFDVQVSGSAGWQDHRLTTAADLVVHEGSASMPDQKLSVSGIQGRLAFNDLLAPASVPGQVVTIDRIQAGDFTATDAAVRFTLEPGPSLVLENMQLNWAGGQVSTESVRIPSPDRSVALTLYCDRIELNRLLAQMGGFDAQGKGSLNGRIPVVIKNGEISFDNAFLFSTPGQGGRIVIQNPEKLKAGIPVDASGFTQLDLASEALKDFEYAWAKLTFDTQGETLTANMELDGKPGRVLPFVYKKEINSFVRVDAESPGSRFQGIKLDVNLTLPFNQVMTFGNKMQKLLK